MRTLRVLFLTSGKSGLAHLHHAMALRDAVEDEARRRGVRVEQVICELSPDRSAPLAALPRLYVPLVRSMPWLWGLLYRVTDSRWAFAPSARLVASRLSPRFLEELRRQRPDVVIAVYAHIGAAVNDARLAFERETGRRVRLLIAVSDIFTTHAAWVSGAPDAVLTGSEEGHRDCLRHGIAPEAVRITGVPVERKFREARLQDERTAGAHRRAVRERLGIADGAYCVLLTGGGPGAGDLDSIAQKIAKHPFPFPLHLIVVAGKNERLLARLQTLAGEKPMTALGAVDEMQELMLAADLVVGKAGAMTMLEALELRRAQLITSFLPGQERANADFVESSGIGKCCFRLADLPAAIRWMREHAAEVASAIDAALAGRPSLSEASRLNAEAVLGQ